MWIKSLWNIREKGGGEGNGMKTIITRSKRTCQFPQIWHVSALAPAAVGDVLPCIANQITCIWIYIWDTAHLLHIAFAFFTRAHLLFQVQHRSCFFVGCSWPWVSSSCGETPDVLVRGFHLAGIDEFYLHEQMFFFNISDRSENLVPTQSIIHAHGCLHTLDSWSKSGTAEVVPTTARKTASIVYQWFWLVVSYLVRW